MFCSQEQMENIRNHHPELSNFWGGNEADMKRAITEAEEIVESSHGEEFNVYYLGKRGKNTELKVVVRFDGNREGVLYAAQPSTVGQRKPGETVIWPPTKS